MTQSELIVFPDATYRRVGECNRCGECCQYLQLPLARALIKDEKHWVELHPGVSIKDDSVRIEIPCAALLDGRCLIFGQKNRPSMCRNYPEGELLDAGCSYTFEKVNLERSQ